MNIVIVEDDIIIREKLAAYLEKNGYNVKCISDFQNVVLEIMNTDANLILLDVNLPFCDGFQICAEINKKINVPVIFVTSRSTTKDEIKSIQVGGFDFITKPYDKNILLEKIRRALNINNPINYKDITKNGYTLDLHLATLKYQNKEVELTRNEFRILYYFFINSNRVITKEELLKQAELMKKNSYGKYLEEVALKRTKK